MILALVLPALGPVQWLLTGMGGDAPSAVYDAHDHDQADAGHAHHHPHDRSDVPGSPTHPADHNCLACQVLAQLGRCCALPPTVAPAAPSEPSFHVVRRAEQPLVRVADYALAPPARGPPPTRRSMPA